MRIKEEIIYCTHTCVFCGKAFIGIDNTNAQCLPPDYKHCDKCKKIKNDKNKIKINKDYYMKKDKVLSYIQKHISNKHLAYFGFYYDNYEKVINQYIKNKEVVIPKTIFNKVTEILNYTLEEEKIKKNVY